ncbi:MAG: type IV pilus biogenesis protein PilP [Sterolibacterium sp.]|jgi:type IV pilus biogenesis protein PilP|nr:type IV pilus biogenesis protein PilP [Sterolibacterium sp.]
MYSRKLISLTLIATCYLGSASTALAEDSIQEQLQRINDSIAVLNAKRQELELRSQVASKQAEIDRITNADSMNIDRSRHPVVQSIEGADGKLVAMLAFGSGIQQNVRQGDSIPGGWQVSKVAVDAVYITRGRDRVRLAYGHEPPAPPPSSYPTAVPPLNPTGR